MPTLSGVNMRAILSAGLVFLCAAVALRAAMPLPLERAVGKLIADTDRWAYTQEVRVSDLRGKPEDGVTVERFDPSKPEEEQWTLRLYKGHVPSESDRRAWKKQKAREARRREKPLGEIIDFERAALSSENDLVYTYRLPIKPGASRRLPSEKFFVLIQVDKARIEISHVAVKAEEKFRLSGLKGLAVRVDRAEFEAKFHVVDERYAAQPATLTAEGAVRVAWLFRTGGRAEVTWREFERVKPYKDRFDVQIGDVKALDF